MATGELNSLVNHLRRAVLLRDWDGLTDGQLLESFVEGRDGTAFEVLVRRHGAMVLGVCRRVLGHVQDAEDAFQATFLVLARKADTVRPRELVGKWLYGVAYRTALSARSMQVKHRSREKQIDVLPEPAISSQSAGHEWKPLLDQELNGLTEKYRAAIILCDLQGCSRKEAARQLAIPEGTLSSRLAMGRKLLGNRLARRGCTLSGGVLATLLAHETANASPSLLTATAQAATKLASSHAAAGGLVSTKVALLTQGAMKTMRVAKLKMAMTVVAITSLVGGAVAFLAHRGISAETKQFAGANIVFADGEKQKEGDKRRDDEKPREGDKGKAAKPKVVTLTGVVSKKELKRKREDGTAFTVTHYYLTEKDGKKIMLPTPRRRDDGTLIDKFDLGFFVGKKVMLTGKALLAKIREGKDAPMRVVRMLTVTNVKEVKKKK